MSRAALVVLMLIAGVLSGACMPFVPILEPSLSPDVEPTPPLEDTGWRPAGSGIETRERVVVHRNRRDRLYLARLDPAQVAFRVRYDPPGRRRVGEWLETEGARLVVNAGYFDTDFRVLGMLVADGETHGETYQGFGGLFGVSGGSVQVRSLIRQPYQPGEVFDQMAQSFPMLLVEDGQINVDMSQDDAIAPRTVVGLDHEGRVVFLVSPLPTFSLPALAAWLADSDLGLESALNLDGGTSSGLIVQTPNGRWGLDSWVPVPAIIAAW